MKTVQNSCKFLTCLVGISFLSLAQAKWVFENGKLSNDTIPTDAYCVFPAQIATLEDGAGNSVTGLQIIGINGNAAKLIDFTSVETDTGYKVISVAAPEFARNCREFIGPDVFDLTTNMFMTTKTTVSGKTTTKLQVYITNIVISANIMQFPAKWAMNAPLKTLKPTQFPYLKSFGDRCFYNCTNFQAGASQLIMRGVTNIGNEAFKEVSLE